MTIFYEMCLFIDGIIYDFVDYIYDIFEFLARINLFGEEQYNDIVGRIYIVLGVLMLFVLAYTLLRAIINPDEFSKGEKSFGNLAKNIVVSLIIIVMLPTVFRIAFSIQNAVLNSGTITKIVLGNTDASYKEMYDDTVIKMSPGRMIAYESFSSFFYPNPESCKVDEKPASTREDIEKCKDSIHSEVLVFFNGKKTLREVDAEVKLGTISMRNYSKFGKAVKNDKIRYSPLISTACGIFLVYVLLNFVFDMALRIIKLMFYQIIAPIPVVCRIIPFGQFKDVFKNWLKQVTSVFFEVFVRIGIMNFGILLIKLTNEAFNNGYRGHILKLGASAYENIDFFQFLLARLLIDMGIIMFIRKAPELLSKLFGIDTGGMKLGIKDRLAQGGALTAGAAIGAAGGMALKNGVPALRAAGKGIKGVGAAYKAARTSGQGRLGAALASRRSIGSAAGTILRGAASTVAGAASGGVRGGYRALNAKDFKDVGKSTSGAIDTATENKKIRANYRAKHLSNKPGIRGEIGTMINVGLGHAKDRRDDALLWLDGGLSKYEDEEKFIKDYTDAIDAIDSSKDALYTRNANNAKIQQAYMEKILGDAKGTLSKIGNAFDASKVADYKDAYGKNVDVHDQASFDKYKNQLKSDIAALQKRVDDKTALDKTAMEKYIKGKQDEGYQGNIQQTISSIYAEAEAIRKDAWSKVDANGFAEFDPSKVYKDAYGNVVTIQNNLDFQKYIGDLGREISLIEQHKDDDSASAQNFIQERIAAGQNVNMNKKKSYILQDFYGAEHNINNEGQYYTFLSLLDKQMGDIDRGTKKLIASKAVENTATSKAELSAWGLDTNATDRDLINQMAEKGKTAKDIATERIVMARTINKGTTPDLSTYSAESDFKDIVKARATEIYAEKAKLQREKAERDAAKKGQ